MLLEIRAAARAALFQACQQRLPGDSEAFRIHRKDGSDRAADLLRAAAAVPTCRAWVWGGAAAGRASQSHRDLLRSAAVLVSAAFGIRNRCWRISATRRHPAAHAYVPLMAFPERLVAANPQPSPAVCEPGAG